MKCRRLVYLVWFITFAPCQFSPMGQSKDVYSKVKVSTTFGDVLGEKIDFSHQNLLENGTIKLISRFLGIPYAQAPLHHLRFRPPLDPLPWKPAVYNATFFRSACIQDPEYINRLWKNFTVGFSEDCLYLNVYAPVDLEEKPFNKKSNPVMVYIHGGGYEAGSPSVSPGDILPLWGVVLVTIQYRLGMLGFFTTGDHNAPGNYGMLDQVHALKWVNKNIRSFGGDPNKVTIFGESAGGSSVGLQQLSPLSEGLFHRVIAISGIDFSPFAIATKENAVQLSKRNAAKLNCAQNNNEKLLACLRKVDAKKTIIGLPNSWRPFVDRKFLTDTPRHLRKNGSVQKVPLMAGFTSDEGAYFIAPNLSYKKLYRSNFVEYIDMLFQAIQAFGLETEDKTGASFKLALHSQYTPWPDSTEEVKLVQKIIDLVTDYSFAAPVDAVLEEHSKLAPVFMYEYGYRSMLSPNSPWMGVTHKDDTPFEFGFPLMNISYPLQNYDKGDQNMSRLIITLFTNFAKYGNPTPDQRQEIKWSPFNQSNREYLYIQLPPETRSRFRPCNLAFWNRYYRSLVDTTQLEKPRPVRSTGGKIPLLSICALSYHVIFVLVAVTL